MTASNFLTSDVQVLTFPIAFTMLAPSSNSFLSLDSSADNSSHYLLNISTSGDNVLSSVTFSVISFRRTEITSNYQAYVDMLLVDYLAGIAINRGDVFLPDQYKYRNSIYGAISIHFLLNGSQTQPNFFYYNVSSDTTTTNTFGGLNHRIASCPAGYSFEPTAVTCIDVCPGSTFPDAASSICLPCHYSC